MQSYILNYIICILSTSAVGQSQLCDNRDQNLNLGCTWFLEMLLSGKLVCVPVPQAIKNHLCEVKPE